MSQNSLEKLPKFERPPLIEVVLGVQFFPLPQLSNALLGAFWKRLGPGWPFLEDVPLLQPQFEDFTESAWTKIGFPFKFTQDLGFRLQIKNTEKDRMIQVQNGRFHYNWLNQEGNKYPHFGEVKKAFDEGIAEFQGFLLEETKTKLQANQWEITYVNHLPRGTVWNHLEEVAELFRLRPLLTGGPAGTRLGNFVGEWHFEIPPQRGRLHVQLQHGRVTSSVGSEVLIFTLTARGPLVDGLGLEQGLKLGHETIVRSFVELTSEAAHLYWGLIHDS